MIELFKVFIDPGHGGTDPGACSRDIREKDIALDVSVMLGELLTKEGIQVAYSRTIDSFIPLTHRARMSNHIKADVFISVHCNAHSNPHARGLETFHHRTSSKGKILASKVQKSILAKGLYSKDRGIKQANFYVLRKTNAVAILLELGFLTNQTDLSIITRNKREFSKAVAEAIIEYLR